MEFEVCYVCAAHDYIQLRDSSQRQKKTSHMILHLCGSLLYIQKVFVRTIDHNVGSFMKPVHIEMLIHDLDIILGVVGQRKMNSWRSARWLVDGFKLPANKLNLGMDITSFSTGPGDMHGFNSLLSHYITRV